MEGKVLMKNFHKTIATATTTTKVWKPFWRLKTLNWYHQNHTNIIIKKHHLLRLNNNVTTRVVLTKRRLKVTIHLPRWCILVGKYLYFVQVRTLVSKTLRLFVRYVMNVFCKIKSVSVKVIYAFSDNQIILSSNININSRNEF